MPKDSVFSMAFGFPRSVSQLTTDVQQLSKECNSCNSNFNELRKEIRETQSAPPQASTKRITNLTKQKNEKKKKTQKTWITDHEAKKEILRAFLCQVPNGKDDDTLVALAMNEILEIFSEAGENSKYSNGSFAKARTFCRLKDGQRERRFTCQEPVSSNGTPSPTPFPSPEKAWACVEHVQVFGDVDIAWKWHQFQHTLCAVGNITWAHHGKVWSVSNLKAAHVNGSKSSPHVPAPQVPAPQVPAPQVPALQVPASQVPASQVPALQVPASQEPIADTWL